MLPEASRPAGRSRQTCEEGGEISEEVPALRLYDESAPRILHSGRHNLTREQVAASQRLRLLEAAMASVGELGFDGSSVGDIIDRAGVSRRTFYDHYGSKEACFLDSYDKHAELIFNLMLESGIQADGWAGAMLASIEAFLGFFVEHPLVAKVYAFDAVSSNEAVMQQHHSADERFVLVYRALDELAKLAVPGKSPLSDETIWMLIGGTVELVRFKIRTDGVERLLEVAPAMFGAVSELLFAPKSPPKPPAGVRARLEQLAG